MPIKCTGAEFRSFLDDDSVWNPKYLSDSGEMCIAEYCLDDEEIYLNGQPLIDLEIRGDDEEDVVVHSGSMYDQGPIIQRLPDLDLVRTLRAWMKKQHEITLRVTVSKADEVALRDLLTESHIKLRIS